MCVWCMHVIDEQSLFNINFNMRGIYLCECGFEINFQYNKTNFKKLSFKEGTNYIREFNIRSSFLVFHMFKSNCKAVFDATVGNPQLP